MRSGERDRGQADIAYEFTRMFPISVIVEMLDLPQEDHEKFERWYVSIMEFLSNLDGSQEPIDSGLRTRQELADYLLPVIAERRGGDGEDLISLFCRAEVDGEQLTDDEIRGFVSLTLTAGGETTDRALSSLFSSPAWRDRFLVVLSISFIHLVSSPACDFPPLLRAL